MARLMIRLPTECCGTCQHWTGPREVADFGRRLACGDGVYPCPWRRSGSQARQRPACRGAGGSWKPWVGLP